MSGAVAGSPLGFRRVATQAGWAAAIEIGGMAARYLLAFVVARALGAEGFGLYVLAIAFATAAGIVGRVGFDRASMRFVAFHGAQGASGDVLGVLRFGSFAGAVSGSIVGVTLWLVAPAIEGAWGQSGLGDSLRGIAPAIPLIALGDVWRYGLRGFHDVRAAVFLEKILIPATTLLIVSALLVVGRAQPTWVVMAAGAAYSCSALLAAWALVRKTRLVTGPPVYRPGDWLRFALPMSMEASLLFVLAWADQLIIGLVADATSVGLYSAALRLAVLVSFPLLAVNAILGPTVAGLFASGDRASLRLIYARLTWGTGIAGACIAGVLIGFGEPMLGMFGSEFRAAYPALVVIVFGQMANAMTGSAGVVLGMTGHVRLRLANALMTAASTIGLCFLLVPPLGIAGGAIATATAMTIINMLQVIEVRVTLGFWGYDLRQLRYWLRLLGDTPLRLAARMRREGSP